MKTTLMTAGMLCAAGLMACSAYALSAMDPVDIQIAHASEGAWMMFETFLVGLASFLTFGAVALSSDR